MITLATRVPSLEEITRSLPLQKLEGISAPTAKSIDEHNAAVNDLAGYISSTRAAVDTAAAAVGDDGDDLLNLGSAIENRRFAQTDGYSIACRLWRQRHTVAVSMVVDLSPAVSDAEKAHEKATATATTLLSKAGLTADEMLAAQVNERTAAAQLDGIVRQCHPVRLAAAQVVNTKARLDAAHQQVTTSKSGETAARSATKAMAERMAATL